MDRYQLYEVSVQDPATLLAFLLRLHGGDPRVLAEDCSGTAALARCFADSHPERRALALDLDAEALLHWKTFRLANAATGTCVVGHQDLLAVPV